MARGVRDCARRVARAGARRRTGGGIGSRVAGRDPGIRFGRRIRLLLHLPERAVIGVPRVMQDPAEEGIRASPAVLAHRAVVADPGQGAAQCAGSIRVPAFSVSHDSDCTYNTFLEKERGARRLSSLGSASSRKTAPAPWCPLAPLRSSSPTGRAPRVRSPSPRPRRGRGDWSGRSPAAAARAAGPGPAAPTPSPRAGRSAPPRPPWARP